MGTEIAVTVIAGIFLAVAIVGTVYPVLPGSIVAIVTLIAWAWLVGSTAAWVAAAVGTCFAAIGFSASAVLTGRRLKRERVPGHSIVVAMAAGIAGMFLIPVVGLFVGFAAGLLAAEYARRHDLGAAAKSSAQALKAMGIGVLVEFGMACLAASAWTIGVIVHFAA